MNGDNGQHKSNALLKQILEISQHTLEAQNMQLKVLVPSQVLIDG